ncbi:Arc family DNA-binding protein [Enterobacter ludwigii]|uniref:Arc family DNA-binding protein n=1 Tax=Enterobacter ludwigii TaxID=299767 RepID=UPI0005CFD6E9|nr:Arc family DNA-binding protein [Enterobacter ludwigii]QLA09013.1 Arc family DNA-binding protein [Enterobacter ludwigii]
MKGASLIAPLGVRIPDELKEKIQTQAKANGRSMNAEIVFILDEAMRDDDRGDDDLNRQLIDVYEEKIKAMEDYIKMQKQAFELATEQISLLKTHIKSTTGFDVQAYFDKTIDYDGIRKAIEKKNKGNS